MIEYIHPWDSIEKIEQNIKKSQALWLEECYPVPLGQTSDHYVYQFEKLVEKNPDKIFFYHNCPEFLNGKQYSNVIWLPITMIKRAWKMKKYKYSINFSAPREKNFMYFGGEKTRVHRTLVNFWLGSNINKNLFLFTNKNNNNLNHYKKLIETSSKKYKLNVRKQLGDKWVNHPDGFHASTEMFFSTFLSEFFSKCNISLVTEANDYELYSGLTEKTLNSFFSGCFPLWVGSYKITYYLKKLGFEMYDFIDYTHLNTTNRADLTLQGLESNKEILLDNNRLNDLRIDYQKQLEYNHAVILNHEKWLDQFKKEFHLFLNFINQREKQTTEKNKSLIENYLQVDYYKYLMNYFDNV